MLWGNKMFQLLLSISCIVFDNQFFKIYKPVMEKQNIYVFLQKECENHFISFLL